MQFPDTVLSRSFQPAIADRGNLAEAPRDTGRHDFGEDFERDLEDGERLAELMQINHGRRGFLGQTGKFAAAMGTFGLCFRQLDADGRLHVFAPPQAAAPQQSPEPTVPAPLPAGRVVPLTPADRREWAMFKRRFVTAEGRVVDTGNNCVSHTEGQGWGMLLAVAFDDRETFERLHRWTEENLRRAYDNLHCWRYDPNAATPVADTNNATDGDLFIAWALWRAACRWDNEDYAARARAIGHDILALLVRRAGARTVLLPGAAGFEQPGAFSINLSYYCFPAMADLAHAVPSPVWAKLRDDGLALIAKGRFGRWQLPPDWLSVSRRNGDLAPASGWPPRFSYDAVRVPLYMTWARCTLPAVHAALATYWTNQPGSAPAWVDLETGATAGYVAPPGMVAIAKLATSVAETSLPSSFPSIHTSPDYYSSALILLARLAWHESREA